MTKLILLVMMWFVSNLSIAQYHQANTIIITTPGTITEIGDIKTTKTHCSHCFTIDTVFVTLATNSILLPYAFSGTDSTYFGLKSNNQGAVGGGPQAIYLGTAQLKFRFRNTVTSSIYEVISLDTIGVGFSAHHQVAVADFLCGCRFIQFPEKCINVLIDTVLVFGNTSTNYQIFNACLNGEQTTNLSFWAGFPDSIVILWLDGSMDTVVFYNQPSMTMYARQSLYVTGGWLTDGLLVSNRGCWGEYDFPFFEDQCGNRFTFNNGMGNGPNNDSHEFGWLGWWKYGQTFIKGNDTITIYSDPINFLPVQAQHNVSGWYEINRDPLCMGDSTSLLCVLNHNCLGTSYTMTDVITANLFLPDNVGVDGTAWWDTTTTAKTYTYEVENSNEFYTISFNLGNCIGLSTKALESNEESILVYPNPTTGIIKISGATPNVTLTVHDALGRLLWQGSGATEVDLSNNPAGIYFLTVNSPERRETFKIVKQ